MRMKQKVALMASTGLGLVFLSACSDSATAPTSSKFVSEVNLAVGEVVDGTVVLGKIKVCKQGNAGGSFDVSRVGEGGSVGTVPGDNSLIASGTCEIVAEDVGLSGTGSQVTIVEDPAANTVQTIVACTFLNEGGVLTSCLPFNYPLFVNSFHGFVVTYQNIFTPPDPPPAICDFITYGRLVTEIGGQKVVISGNAGGNNANGSIKNEFHITYLGVDYHVADAVTYGPIAAGPLNSAAFPNSRVVTGIAKNGVSVELRLWDGGEPGKGTDKVWFSLVGPGINVAIGGPTGQFIDQGNMQYHSNCRGPKK